MCSYVIFSVDCDLLEGSHFGQTEPPLWEFIKSILDRYPEGGQILKVSMS